MALTTTALSIELGEGSVLEVNPTELVRYRNLIDIKGLTSIESAKQIVYERKEKMVDADEVASRI